MGHLERILRAEKESNPNNSRSQESINRKLSAIKAAIRRDFEAYQLERSLLHEVDTMEADASCIDALLVYLIKRGFLNGRDERINL